MIEKQYKTKIFTNQPRRNKPNIKQRGIVLILTFCKKISKLYKITLHKNH